MIVLLLLLEPNVSVSSLQFGSVRGAARKISQRAAQKGFVFGL